MYRIITRIIPRYPRAITLTSKNTKLRGRQLTTEGMEKNEEEASENEKIFAVDIAVLTEEVARLKEKNVVLYDKYNKAVADSETLRRSLKQIEDTKLFSIQGCCKDLLEVADTLDRATKTFSRIDISDNPHMKKLYEGLLMTHASLMQVFRRHGLKPFYPINQKFNPKLHEVLFEKKVKGVEPNTVVEVSKIGYKLHGRCIRPALVGVSRAT